MITYRNVNNYNRYKALFDRANADLVEYFKAQNKEFSDEDKITCVEDYFTYIGTLTGISEFYAMLPLPVIDYDAEQANVTDEGAFHIDVVTREIKIPKSFDSKFGKGCMAVQGDNGAEVVWFNIPRYVDATDLNDPNMKIIIQWQGAMAPDGKTFEADVSENFYVDTTYNPGNILFGWVLDKRITKYPGTVKFAVRFYKTKTVTENGKQVTKLDYSLSSLTSTFIVQPSLDFDLVNGDYKLEDTEVIQQIKDRFVNSYPLVDGEIVPATDPIFKRQIVTTDNTYMDLINFDESDEETYLRTRAMGDGLIAYTWYRKPIGVETPSKITTESKMSYIKIDKSIETQFKNDQTYFKWIQAEDGTSHFEIINGQVGNNTADYEGDIYICDSALMPKSTGTYYVVASNRKGKTYAELEGNACIIPGPSLPVLDDQYKKPENGEVMHFILDAKTADTTETATIKGYSTTKLTVAARVNEDEPAGDKSKITYRWYKDGEFQDVTASELTITEPGNYTAEAVAKRNGDEVFVETNTYRVTHLPTKVVFNTPTTTNYYSGQTIALSHNDMSANDNVTYQWYKMTLVEGELDNPTIGEDDVAIEGATAQQYKAVVDDNFIYCKATAHLNGTAITTNSAIFRIFDR